MAGASRALQSRCVSPGDTEPGCQRRLPLKPSEFLSMYGTAGALHIHRSPSSAGLCLLGGFPCENQAGGAGGAELGTEFCLWNIQE